MWVADLLDIVFTKVKKNLNKYDMSFSTENENVIPTSFPTLYMQELPFVETGQDLDNRDVPFVIYTIQIKIWAKSESQCKSIIYSAIDAMKRMRFDVTAFPDIQTQDNISYAVARFRRTIGDGDKL